MTGAVRLQKSRVAIYKCTTVMANIRLCDRKMSSRYAELQADCSNNQEDVQYSEKASARFAWIRDTNFQDN